jgi:hypothetical protein
MGILNAKANMFTIWFPPNFFYPSVVKSWEPVVRRLKLQYQNIEDFFNASIQSITIPAIDLPTPTQQQSQFEISYRGGKELEPTFEKTLDVTFKLAEGFITYWMIFDQIEEYLRYKEDEVFWPSMYVSFLDHHGFELVAFEFNKIVPTGLSTFDVSYATTAADFNTFTLGLRYNRFNIKRRTTDDTYSTNSSNP